MRQNIFKFILMFGLLVLSLPVNAEQFACSDYEEMHNDISELINDLDRVEDIYDRKCTKKLGWIDID